MTELTKKEKAVEMLRVQASMAEAELNILKRKEEIERLEDVILKQQLRIEEIKKELGG